MQLLEDEIGVDSALEVAAWQQWETTSDRKTSFEGACNQLHICNIYLYMYVFFDIWFLILYMLLYIQTCLLPQTAQQNPWVRIITQFNNRLVFFQQWSPWTSNGWTVNAIEKQLRGWLAESKVPKRFSSSIPHDVGHCKPLGGELFSQTFKSWWSFKSGPFVKIWYPFFCHVFCWYLFWLNNCSS